MRIMMKTKNNSLSLSPSQQNSTQQLYIQAAANQTLTLTVSPASLVSSQIVYVTSFCMYYLSSVHFGPCALQGPSIHVAYSTHIEHWTTTCYKENGQNNSEKINSRTRLMNCKNVHHIAKKGLSRLQRRNIFHFESKLERNCERRRSMQLQVHFMKSQWQIYPRISAQNER